MILADNGMYVPSTFHEHVQFVNEAYFGKTENLLRLEKAIGELRATYSLKRDYTATPEVKRIENIVKKQFGMDYFTLNIVSTNKLDAYTITVGTRFDIIKDDVLEKMVIADQKTGYHFKNKNGFLIIVAISGGILLSQEFTNAEIVVIMLHEIGHNFSDVISKDVKVANYEWYEAFMAEAALDACSYEPIIEENKNSTQVELKKNEKPLGKFQTFLKYIGGRIADFGFNIELFCISILSGTIALTVGQQNINMSANKKPDTMKSKPGRQDEVIADKFAAIYGYGIEQSTALAKMTLKTYPGQDFLSKLPFGNLLLRYSADFSKDYFKSEEHPHIIQRTNTMIESLKFELTKKNLDPDIRKIIEQQIKDMEECKKKFMEIRDNDSELAKVERMYSAVVDKKFPQAVTEKLEKAINKQIDELCNKKYK